MTRFVFEGTGRTTGGGGKAVLLILGALLLLGDGGAVAAVGAGMFDALLAAVVTVVLLIVALGAFLVHRARNPSPEGFVRTPAVRMPVAQQLPGPERPAIGSAPRELHQHWHLHVGAGADPAVVTEIMRQQRES